MIRLMFFVTLSLAWNCGEAYSQGGGAFSYVDSSGNRYGGTYGLKDGKIVSTSGDPLPPSVPIPIPDPVPFADPIFTGDAFPGDDFGAAYFANLDNLLHEVFKSNLENQKLALDAARKAYDLTSSKPYNLTPNKATTFNPAFPTRFPAFNTFPPFGFLPTRNIGMPPPPPPPMFQNFGSYGNSAYAGAAAGPGYNHHIAAINPGNPAIPNVNQVNHYADTTGPRRQGGFYSVSSKSYSSSSNINGQEVNHRGAETLVNDNGRITGYKVNS